MVPLDDSPLGLLADWVNPMRYIWVLSMHVVFYEKTFRCGRYEKDGTEFPASCSATSDGSISVREIFVEEKYMVNRSPSACVAFLLGVFVVVRFGAFWVLQRRMRKHQYELSKLDTQVSLDAPKPMNDVAVDVLAPREEEAKTPRAPEAEIADVSASKLVLEADEPASPGEGESCSGSADHCGCVILPSRV